MAAVMSLGILWYIEREHGIDISKEAIEQVTVLSRQNGYDALFTYYDGYHIPFEENTFDVIIIWAQSGQMRNLNKKRIMCDRNKLAVIARESSCSL